MSTNARTVPWKRVGAVAGAVVAVNLVILAVARMADVPLDVPRPDGAGTMAIGPAEVAVATLLPLAIGAVLAAGLLRLRRGATITVGLTIVVTLLSFAPPLGLDVATSTKVVLALMHPTTAAAYLVGLAPALRRLEDSGARAPSADHGERPAIAGTT